MSSIVELRQRRSEKWEQARQFLDAKRGADDRLSAEDAAAYDKMEAEVVDMGREIERLERTQLLDQEMKTVTDRALISPDDGLKPGRAGDYRRHF
jgi:hypothetical protein